MSSANAWKDQVLANGRYQLLDMLGEGGMGIVFHARDRNLGTDVVVKVPKFSQLGGDEALRRFQQEIRSLVTLSHKYIVRILDVGEHDSVPFAVMEYHSGGNLKSRRQPGADNQPQPQPPESLRTWLPRVAAALDYAHGKKYLHRDVKPDNILFDATGNAYLSDFGIAKALSALTETGQQSALTVTGMVIGTPGYIAPEVLLGETLDGRADQYSLAITVYEMLTGRCPFAGLPLMVIAGQQMSNLPVPLSSVMPGIADGLTQAVRTALAHNREQRYPSCEAFARAALAGSVRPAQVPAARQRTPSVVPPPPPALPEYVTASTAADGPPPLLGRGMPSALSERAAPSAYTHQDTPRNPLTPPLATPRPLPATLLPLPPRNRRRRRLVRLGKRRLWWSLAALGGVVVLCVVLLILLFVRKKDGRKTSERSLLERTTAAQL